MSAKILKFCQKYLLAGFLAVASTGFTSAPEATMDDHECGINHILSQYENERLIFIDLFKQHTILFNNYANACFTTGVPDQGIADYYLHLIVLNAEQIATLYAFYPSASWLLHTSIEEYVEQGTDYITGKTQNKSPVILNQRAQYWYTKTNIFVDVLTDIVYKLKKGQRAKLHKLYKTLTAQEIQLVNFIFANDPSNAELVLNQMLILDEQIADIAFQIFLRLLKQQAPS